MRSKHKKKRRKMAKTRLHCSRPCVTDNGTVCKDYKTILCPESEKHAAAVVAAYRKKKRCSKCKEVMEKFWENHKGYYRCPRCGNIQPARDAR